MNPDLVEARRALLDTLEALGTHRAAVVLVGAQAIYLHVGDADLAVEPYTQDGDVALDPAELDEQPPLEQALTDAGFTPDPDKNQPGRWLGAHGVVVDLMVPEALGGGGRRGARLPEPHGKRVARKARGLEATLVDNEVTEVTSFDPQDTRTVSIKVAGPASLLVAKLHKVHERKDDESRTKNKDALDVLRILRGSGTQELAVTMDHLQKDPLSREVTKEAMEYLRELFESPESQGSLMAAAAVEGQEDPAEIAAACAALTGDLLHELGGDEL